MKKLLAILVISLIGCDQPKVENAPKRMESTNLGRIRYCTDILRFEDSGNTCYVADYCGSSSPTISCVKNEVAPQK